MLIKFLKFTNLIILLFSFQLTLGCSSVPGSDSVPDIPTASETSEYLIGPGDSLQVFVWGNPDFSVTVPVRPDGKITTPLVEDIAAVGKTPTQLAREIEKRLERYIKRPVVTVLVTEFIGTSYQQIRIIGEASRPQAIPYRSGMTVLDVMISVGGLTEFAAGNRAKIVRKGPDSYKEIEIRLDDLLQDGDITANVVMRPGDILIIPQSWF
jgi:polysaccharide export outer membrane protein